MNIIKYMDFRYQEIALHAAKSKVASISAGAETGAIQILLTLFKWFTAILFIPAVFLGYLAVLLRIQKRPLPALDLMQAEHQASENMRLGKLRRKVGVQ